MKNLMACIIPLHASYPEEPINPYSYQISQTWAKEPFAPSFKVEGANDSWHSFNY